MGFFNKLRSVFGFKQHTLSPDARIEVTGKDCSWKLVNGPKSPEPILSHKGITVRQRVIVRSNENEPYMIGWVSKFEDYGGKTSTPIPVVKDEQGKEWICFGLVRPWTLELEKLLDVLDPKEQWNLLAKNYKIDDPRSW